MFLASLDLQIREEAEKWCTRASNAFPRSNCALVECRLWLYALPADTKPNMSDVWKTYDEYVKVSPANVQDFDKLKGKMMVGLAMLRAGLPDSAKAIAASSQGDPQIDPRGETINLAAIIYAQAGDKNKAIDLMARWYAANPQQRAVAANDQGMVAQGSAERTTLQGTAQRLQLTARLTRGRHRCHPGGDCLTSPPPSGP